MNTQTLFVSALLAVFLSACGSSGGSGPNVGHPPAPPAETLPDTPSKPEAPAKPEAQPKPEAEPKPEAQPIPPLSQQDLDLNTFQKLSVRIKGGIESNHLTHLVLDAEGKNIQLKILHPDANFVGQPLIETLRGHNGRLIGYYGHAAVSREIRNEYNNQPEGAALHLLYLQDADNALLKRPEGLADLHYRGTMYYHYPRVSNEMLEAPVTAVYHGGNKTLAMQIDGSGRDGVQIWHLGPLSSLAPRGSKELAVPVRDDGSVGGWLWLDTQGGPDARLKRDAQFTGGLYGEHGEVLTGQAQGVSGEIWEGVIGATAAKPE